jgi:acetyl esterase
MSNGLDIHPDMQVLISAKSANPAGSTVAEMRDAWSRYSAMSSRPSPAGIQTEDAQATPTDGGAAIPVRWYLPVSRPSPSACVIYLHGGGFMKGDLDSSDAIAWGIAEAIDGCVVSVDYRLAPEHAYPAAFDDCYEVLSYVSSRAESLGIDTARIALWGDSAGGCLAAACCIATRDRGGPPVAAQVLVYPCLTDRLTAPSYSDFADSPGLGLTTAAMDQYWDWYLRDQRPTEDPLAAPLVATDLSGLAPAFVHIAEYDPLADDGREYAARLESAGVSAELRCATRMIHGFLRTRFTGTGGAAEWEAVCNWTRSRLEIGSA